MNQQIIDQVIKNINTLVSKEKIKESLKILKSEISPISEDLERSIILLESRFNGLENNRINGLRTAEELGIETRIIFNNILSVLGTIESEVEVQRIMGQYAPLYTTTSEADLEKIQGTGNTLLPMNWIYKCAKVSKSVCQVIRDDGVTGTGWLLEGGWLMTNFHVIPNVDWVGRSKILFNYEEDLNGKRKKTSTYRLSQEGALFSSLLKLDYALIKVIDEGDTPLSDWGFLEVDTFSSPQADQPVTIIQHPRGRMKEIALTKNAILNVDGKKIFYLTDTEKGSSGSPVLNIDWKVIALHHAGKTDEDGGLVIDSKTGERRGANEGILIKDIMNDIESQRANLT